MGKAGNFIALSISSLFISFFVVISVPGSAVGAPQILGLIASTAPVPMTCTGGLCTAEVPAFCLQCERTMPRIGTAYRAGPGTRITLDFTATGGTLHQIPVS